MRRRLAALAFALSLIGASSAVLARERFLTVQDFGGAELTNLKVVFEYTLRASQNLFASTAAQSVVSFDIGVDGRVSNCAPEAPSGLAKLDAILCPVLERRARFTPAKTETGEVIATRGRMSVEFYPN